MKTLIFHLTNENNKDLSYQHGWINAFRKNKNFDLTEINLSIFDKKIKKIKNFYKIKNFIFKKFDLIIFLHSSFSNGCHIPKYIIDLISVKSSFKIYFVGNEYKLMPEKINFCKKIGLNLFITQSLNEKIINLYKDALNCSVIGIPGGGLDKDIFFPKKNFEIRPIEIGFRSYDEPFYFGHQERRSMMDKTIEITKSEKIKVDLSMERKDRFISEKWSDFLNDCKSLIGTNTGYDYFDLEDKTRNEVNKLNLEYGNNFKKIYEEYFTKIKKTNPMRIISGKNIEAAGCKTLQILMEGDYGGYFKPNIHYISVKKDLSNLKECINIIKNKTLCNKIIDNAYTVAVNQLTFENHLKKLLNFLKLRI